MKSCVNNEEYEFLRLDHQLCFPMYACARQVVRRYTPLLKPLGLTYTQYIVFMALWEEDGITTTEICRKLYLDTGTVTPLLKKLEAQGYIKRERNSEDERVIEISLTKKGWEMRDKVKHIPQQIAGCVTLEQDEIQAFYGLLYKLLDSLSESGQEAADDQERQG